MKLPSRSVKLWDISPHALARQVQLAMVVDEALRNSEIALMTDETENLSLRLLREIRTAQEATDAKLDAFIASTGKKLDKLNVELFGVRGRVRKVEEAIEAIARVMSDGAPRLTRYVALFFAIELGR